MNYQPYGSDRGIALAQAKAGGDWFTWIAGLSVVNSLFELLNVPWGFFFGLGLTEIINSLVSGSGSTVKILILVLDLVIAGVWWFFGMQAKQGKSWAFIVGMVCYLVDALLILAVKQYIGAAFHGYALFRMYGGLAASNRLSQIRKAEAQQQFGRSDSPGVWPPPPSA